MIRCYQNEFQRSFFDLRVEVYWNIRKSSYSVRSLEDSKGTRKGIVIGHVPGIGLRDAKFVVQPAGRERAREEGRKNVHAFVRGRVLDVEITERLELQGMLNQATVNQTTVRYNPFKDESFVTVGTKEPIYTARASVLSCTRKQFGPTRPIVYYFT